jgi:hypothetical protein
MACEAADGQAIQKDLVDVARLFDPGMADFDVSTASPAFSSKSIGSVRWRFLDHVC